MREKMLQHEFPFDEKAWGAMKTLLEEKGNEPGKPPTVPVPVPGPGKLSVWLILLFFTVGLGAASLFWSTSIEQKSSSERSSVRDLSQKGLSATVISPSTANTGTQAFHGNSNPEVAVPAPLQKPAVKEQSPDINLFKQAQSSHLPASGKTSANVSDVIAPGMSIQVQSESTLPTVAPDEQREMLVPSQKLLDIINLATPLPSFIPASEYKKLQADSLIRPKKEVASTKRRFEKGFLFGINTNAVDYNPVRVSMLPHVGLFLNYRTKTATSFQAEMVLKYVTGYQLYVETLDITPSGFVTTSLSTNSLIYLEAPVLVKQRVKPKHCLFTGLKPSLNYKVFANGNNLGLNMDNTREYTTQSGIRYFDLGLVLGWEYRFHPRWAFDVRYNQGLMDLTFDQFYRDNSTHLNSDIQVSLRYIFRK